MHWLLTATNINLNHFCESTSFMNALIINNHSEHEIKISAIRMNTPQNVYNQDRRGQGSATWRDHTWMSSDKNSWILRQQRANGITKPVYQDMNTHGLWCFCSWMDLTLDIVIFDDFPGGKSLTVWYYIKCLGWVNDACPVWDTFSTDLWVPLVILEWTVNVNKCPPDLLEAG